MEKFYRIIDANINRASEGLRVLEDLSRFYYNNKEYSEKIKTLRHGIRQHIMGYLTQCLQNRDAINDIGLAVSKELKVDQRTTTIELVTANFKRVQEALRTIEENLKILDNYDLAKIYEDFRFLSYALEKDYFRLFTAINKRNKLDTDLYCLTAQEHSLGRSNVEVVQAMIEAGIKVIQYREKDKEMLEKYRECLEIREMTWEAGVTFIVNDHVELAISTKADGVHIGQDDLPIEKVRKLVGEEMIVGLSTHSPEQAQDAVKRGADYIGVGPIYRTFTKKNVCDPVGLSYLEYVVKNLDIPFVAIGGIKEHNLHEVKEKGAKCIAMVTEIVGAQDIKAKIQSIQEKFKV